MAEKPNWLVAPRLGAGAVTAANPVFDGSGTIGTSSYATVVPAVAVQTTICFLDTIATGTTVDGLLYWVRVSGANRWLVAVAPITARTPSATQLPFQNLIVRKDNPVILEVNDVLAAYSTTNNPLQFRALGGLP